MKHIQRVSRDAKPAFATFGGALTSKNDCFLDDTRVNKGKCLIAIKTTGSYTPES